MNVRSTDYSTLLHQGLKFLLALCAAFLLVGVIHASAFTTTSGDFEVEYKAVPGSDPAAYKDIHVSKYVGRKPDVTLPATVNIGGQDFPIPTFSSNVFRGNTAITSVSIPEGYKEIPSDSFKGCTGLTKVNIPGSVTLISSSAFENCTSLTSLTFDADTASSLSIMNAAFAGCTSLTSVELPARLSEIMTNNNFLRGCTSLSTLSVREGCEKFFSENNMLFFRNDKQGATLVVYPSKQLSAKLTLPDQAGGLPVNAIGGHTFRDSDTLTQVTLPPSLKEVGLFSFKNCTNLNSVYVRSEDALVLGNSCFEGLPSGSIIHVPNQTVADSFESPEPWTKYYDPSTTTIQVTPLDQFPTEEPSKTVSAALTLKAAGFSQSGEAMFDLYLDSASFVNTLLVKLKFDPAQLSMGKAVTVGDVFDNVTSKPAGDGMVDLMFNKLGDVEGYSGSTQVKIATLTLPVSQGASGSLTLTISKADVSGIPNVSSGAVNGTVTLTVPNASLTPPSVGHDVNGDGKVDQVDVTEAQRYYQSAAGGDNWTEAVKSDVNGDGKVDLEDLVTIFRNLTDF